MKIDMFEFNTPQLFVLHWKSLYHELGEVLELRDDRITKDTEEQLRARFLEACTPKMQLVL